MEAFSCKLGISGSAQGPAVTRPSLAPLTSPPTPTTTSVFHPMLTSPPGASTTPLSSPSEQRGLTKPPGTSKVSPVPVLDNNWQANKSSVRERNAVMFNNELMADVHFVVGQGSASVRLPAHKYVLATGSSVFYAMFYGQLADTDKDIKIPDVEPTAFLNLLRYVFCKWYRIFGWDKHGVISDLGGTIMV